MSKLIKLLKEEFGLNGISNMQSSETDFNPADEIGSKIDRAEKIEEVDTITFGMETDDGRLVKVYVRSEQADDFEKALSEELGKEDVIENVLNKLSKEFDIVDVVWPEGTEDEDDDSSAEDDLEVDDVDLDMDSEEDLEDEDTEEDIQDGTASLNKKVWGRPVNNQKKNMTIKKEQVMTYGSRFTKKILGEKKLEESTQFTSIDAIVDEFGKKRIVAWLDNGEDRDLEEAIMEYYMNNGEMPYGTMKARDGDPFNWIAYHFPDALADEGYIDRKTHKWIDRSGQVKEAATGVVSAGRKYKVGQLDARFVTQPQFMIYQALLDLGIPDEALVKSAMKNTIVQAIKDKGNELQTDPVRRQALKFLITRLKEVADVQATVQEASIKTDFDKEDEAEAKKMSPKEKREAEALKVGMLDDRFPTVIQKLVYQTILMLGLPDSFLYKSPFRQQIIKSIKAKAAEFQKDAVRRQSLRIFTSRFEDSSTDGKKVTEGVISELQVPSKLKRWAYDFWFDTQPEQIISRVKELSDEQLTALVDFGNNESESDPKNTGAPRGSPRDIQIRAINKEVTKRNLRLPKIMFPVSEGIVSEAAGQDVVDFIELFIGAAVPKNKEQVKTNLLNSQVWTAFKRAALANSQLNGLVSGMSANLKTISKKLSTAGSVTPFSEEIVSEAKWGEEPLLDDPEDKEKDPDTKVKEKRKKKDNRPADAAEWSIAMDGNQLTIITDGIDITLDPEHAEKLIKTISNKAVIILPDALTKKNKWVFSPKGRTYLVKLAGTQNMPKVLAWTDTNAIEDVYAEKDNEE